MFVDRLDVDGHARKHRTDDGARTGALVLTGAGVAAIIGAGIWLYDSRRAVQQQGATTVWQEAMH